MESRALLQILRGLLERLLEPRLLGHLLSSWGQRGGVYLRLSASTGMSSCPLLPLHPHLPETSLDRGALGISMP